MEKYRMVSKKGEGTFSEVLKCQNTKDNTYWACKRLKQRFVSSEELKNIREIQALRHLNGCPHILQLYEVIFERKTGTLNLIFELMDMNLYELIRTQRTYFSSERIGNYMLQLLKAAEHMHKFGYFHRDIKPENILVKDNLLKLADFGSVRRINTKHPYTEYISTRWYRAPECLLTDGYYSYPMDLWSIGCVMFEIITFRPLFPGANELDQIDKIHDILGTPDPALLEKFKEKSRNIRYSFKPKKGVGIAKFMSTISKDAIDLVNLMCTYDPEQRISAHRALKHKYFNVLFKNQVVNVQNKENEVYQPSKSMVITTNPATGSSTNEQTIMESDHFGKKSADQSIETNSIISIIDLNTINDESINNDVYRPIAKKKKYSIKKLVSQNNHAITLNNKNSVSLSVLSQYSDTNHPTGNSNSGSVINTGQSLSNLSNPHSYSFQHVNFPTKRTTINPANKIILPKVNLISQNSYHPVGYSTSTNNAGGSSVHYASNPTLQSFISKVNQSTTTNTNTNSTSNLLPKLYSSNHTNAANLSTILESKMTTGPKVYTKYA